MQILSTQYAPPRLQVECYTLCLCRKMYMEVSSDVPNFMPQKVSVHGGSTADNAQEISNVSV